MERILSFKKLDDYLNSLADRHVEIKDYCGTSPDELADKISSVAGFGNPGMVFFDIYSKLSGNQQRTFNNRSISFAIVIGGIKPDDYSGRLDAVSLAEEIGLEVLSRIELDSKLPAIGWLYRNFIKESINYAEFDPKGAEGFVGMDFHFDLKTLEPLVANPEKWTDGNLICTNS